MLTKNEAIEKLFRSKQFNRCINKMHPDHLRDDLRGEVMLALCEQPAERIESLERDGKLLFFAVRIVINMVCSNWGTMTRKYRRPVTEFIPDRAAEEVNGRVVKEQREELALAMIGDLYWYEKEVVQLYLRLGNYRAIEKETGIPWEACYKTIQKAAEKIRNRVTANSI